MHDLFTDIEGSTAPGGGGAIIADPIEEGDKKYKKCTTNKGMRYDKILSFQII
ncbi:MAG: hypothetical protein IPI04_15750 [Ignavibacteria bacterium]|nr:hypothetical protein [Ignavibacteria bacterium]